MTDRRNAHLVLVGLPGAGKSTVGPMVAARLAIPFVDLDEEIERVAGRPVREIFALDGEATFREWEREVTDRLVRRPTTVVSPGGGWIMQREAVALLRPPGRMIHLRVSPATALRRMGAFVTQRPLLAGDDPLAALEALASERASAYAAADATLDTEILSLQELVAQAAALASAWGVRVG